MTRFLILITMISMLALPLFASAHGSATHILGTVTEASHDQVTVKTPKGKMVTVYFSADTMFQENGITKDNVRPQVGNRLIAEAAKIEGKLMAIEVKFAAPKSK